MKLRLPSQWVLPILTVCMVLMAIVLPERISAWRDRNLFAAAHVEAFDSEQGIAAPDMSLAQRAQALANVRYGEETDAYIRYQDSFTAAENDQIDKLFITAANALIESGIFPLPKGFSSSAMECISRDRLLLWDRATAGTASFLLLFYYDETTDMGVDLTIDEESGQALIVTIYHPELKEYFAGDDGRELAEIGTQFITQLGFAPADVKYGWDDAYLIPAADSEAPEYHVSQKEDVLHIEAMPEGTASVAIKDYNISITVDGSSEAEIYDAS